MSNQKIRLSFRITKYLLWPIIFAIAFLLFSSYVWSIDRDLGVIGFMVVLINLIIFFVMYFFGQRRIMKETMNISMQVSNIQKDHLIHFDLPHCILDGTGRIMWFNDALYDILEDPKLLDNNIHNYFSGISANQFPTYEESVDKIIDYKEKDYKVVFHKHQLDVNQSSLVNGLSDFYYYSL